MVMRYGSLFSGFGGLDAGLDKAGMACAWQVEINEYAQKVLTKHWPTVPKFRDVRDVGAHNLEPVQLVAGGFPCTDLSYAGKGAGLEGKHSGLWSEYLRIVRELRPEYVLVENVPALLARGMQRVLGDLATCGYDAEWDCIPAASIGAPHRRDRLFIVAYSPSERRNANAIFDRQSLERYRESCGAWGPYRYISGAPFRPPSQIPYASNERISSRTGDRVERFTGLGNSVSPVVAEFIGRRIIAARERRG